MIDSFYDTSKINESKLDFLKGSKIDRVVVKQGSPFIESLIIMTDKGQVRLDLNSDRDSEGWNELEIINYD